MVLSPDYARHHLHQIWLNTLTGEGHFSTKLDNGICTRFKHCWHIPFAPWLRWDTLQYCIGSCRMQRCVSDVYDLMHHARESKWHALGLSICNALTDAD